MKLHNEVSTAIDGYVSTGKALGALALVLALKCVEHGVKADALDAHKALVASPSWKTHRSAIRRVIAGKAEGDKAATEIMAYAYAGNSKAGKAKATAGKAKAAKGKATTAKADAQKGNPLKGVADAQIMAWLVDAGKLKMVAAEIDAMRKALG